MARGNGKRRSSREGGTEALYVWTSGPVDGRHQEHGVKDSPEGQLLCSYGLLRGSRAKTKPPEARSTATKNVPRGIGLRHVTRSLIAAGTALRKSVAPALPTARTSPAPFFRPVLRPRFPFGRYWSTRVRCSSFTTTLITGIRTVFSPKRPIFTSMYSGSS